MIKINNILVTITGASGAGKSTIIKKLIQRDSEKYIQIPTYTTRPLRKGEKQGEQHYFIQKEEYKKLKEKEKILACSTVEGEFYGTPKIDLNNPKYTDKCIIIDIGAKGIEELKQIYKNIIPIYVMPPTQERIKQNRNQNRLQRSLKQIKYAEKVCKWLVINEELEKATDDIEKIILIIQKSGKKVEKITKKDIEYLYKKSMKNPVNKRFLEEFYQQEEQAEEQKTKNKQEQKKKTETKKEKETEEISI